MKKRRKSTVASNSKSLPTLESLTYGTEYWAQRTVEERWAAVELMRRIKYGPAATERMKKVLKVVKR
jgi:hypothetical protein